MYLDFSIATKKSDECDLIKRLEMAYSTSITVHADRVCYGSLHINFGHIVTAGVASCGRPVLWSPHTISESLRKKKKKHGCVG